MNDTPASTDLHAFSHVPPNSGPSTGTSLHVLLCRFNDEGIITREMMPIYETPYLAISHVWGIAEWKSIPCVPWSTIPVSNEKKKFIVEQLRTIVDKEWFWMDVLCIDQRNEEERIAVTQCIPAIFRHAQRTILVRDNSGLYDCCGKSMGVMGADYMATILRHYDEVHNQDTREPVEAVLTRLWVFQEIVLSNTIQIVRCGEVESESQTSTAVLAEEVTKGRGSRVQAASQIINSLSFLAASWSSIASFGDEKADVNDFISAFLNCKTVSREKIFTSSPFLRKDELILQMDSARKTSHTRDFILAIMPQYDFYTVPANAKKMSFGELLVDCFQQGKGKGFTPTPLIQREGLTQEEILLDTPPPSINVPEPTCLGEFMKLFVGTEAALEYKDETRTGPPILKFVPEVPLPPPSDPKAMSQIIHYLLDRSRMLWILYENGDLSNRFRASTIPTDLSNVSHSDAEYTIAIQLLQMIRFNEYKVPAAIEELLGQMPTNYLILLRLITLVCCGLGVTAYKWSRENQVLVFIEFFDQLLPCLVPYSVVEAADSAYIFGLVRAKNFAGKMDYTLVAVDPTVQPSKWASCMLPIEFKDGRE